jgi:RNA polymerase sigma-70 factor (ECF subfamily)
MADTSAYRLFYKRSVRPLAAHLRQLGARDQDLEDVIQDTYVEAFKAWGSLRDDEAAIAWLLTIGRRQLWRQRARRRRRDAELSEAALGEQTLDEVLPAESAGLPIDSPVGAGPTSSIEARLDARATARDVTALIASIDNPTRREAVELFYLQEVPLPELSASTGVKVSTLTTWLCRYREKARRLVPEGVASDAPPAPQPLRLRSRRSVG